MKRRSMGLLLGGLLLFAVAFSLVERLAGPAAAPQTVAASEGEKPAEVPELVIPEIRREGSDGVVIDAGELRRTTIVIDGGPQQVDLLVECLEHGIEASFSEGGSFVPPDASGWLTRGAHRRALAKATGDEIDRIKDECLER